MYRTIFNDFVGLTMTMTCIAIPNTFQHCNHFLADHYRYLISKNMYLLTILSLVFIAQSKKSNNIMCHIVNYSTQNDVVVFWIGTSVSTSNQWILTCKLKIQMSNVHDGKGPGGTSLLLTSLLDCET